MTRRWAVIDRAGRVHNVVLWDPERFPHWSPGPERSVVADGSGEVGDMWDGEKFVKPAPKDSARDDVGDAPDR